MLIGSVVGNISFFRTVFALASEELGVEAAQIFSIVLQIFGYIAMGGGISVIGGAIIVAADKYGIGKFIIGLGAGMGLIGLIVFIIIGFISGNIGETFLNLMVSLIGLNGGFGFTGVLLTIISRFKLKKEE